MTLAFSDSANFAGKTIHLEIRERMTRARDEFVPTRVPKVDGNDDAREANRSVSTWREND